MHTSVRLSIAASVAAGIMSVGAPAFADSAGNNGFNLFNDNNVNVLPVQSCNSGDVNVIAAPVHVFSDNQFASPHNVQCINAPIVDHSRIDS